MKHKRNFFSRKTPFSAILSVILILTVSMVIKAAAACRSLEGLPSTARYRQAALSSEGLVPGTVYDRNGRVLARGKEDGTFALAEESGPALSRLLGAPLSAGAGVNAYTVLGSAMNLYGLDQPPFTLDRFLNGLLPDRKLKGGDLELTVDASLSAFVYDLLEESGAAEAVCLVINYRTGEIHAAVSAHGISELPSALPEDGSLDNLPFKGTAMPGSSIKPIILTALLEQDPSLKDRAYECTGSIIKDGVKIRCSHGVVHGHIENMEDGLAVSCNCYMIETSLGDGTDQKALYEGMKAFGFDSTDTIEGQLSYADPVFYGKNTDLEYLPSAERVQARIGGANARSSAVGMARAYMALFNEGISPSPVLMKKRSVYAGGSLQEIPQGEDRRMCSPEAADLILPCMEAVTLKGTGTKMAVEGRRICSKTGTGEYADGTDENAVWAIAGVHPDDLQKGDEDAWLVLTCLDHYDLQKGENSGNTAGRITGEVLRFLLSEETN